MTVGISEIETASIVVMVDLAWPRSGGIGPIGKRSCPNPTKNFVELCFVDEESIVLWRNLALGIHEIQVVPLSVVTIRNGPHRFGAGRPKTSARNVADTWLSRAHTMV